MGLNVSETSPVSQKQRQVCKCQEHVTSHFNQYLCDSIWSNACLFFIHAVLYTIYYIVLLQIMYSILIHCALNGVEMPCRKKNKSSSLNLIKYQNYKHIYISYISNHTIYTPGINIPYPSYNGPFRSVKPTAVNGLPGSFGGQGVHHGHWIHDRLHLFRLMILRTDDCSWFFTYSSTIYDFKKNTIVWTYGKNMMILDDNSLEICVGWRFDLEFYRCFNIFYHTNQFMKKTHLNKMSSCGFMIQVNYLSFFNLFKWLLRHHVT